MPHESFSTWAAERILKLISAPDCAAVKEQYVKQFETGDLKPIEDAIRNNIDRLAYEFGSDGGKEVDLLIIADTDTDVKKIIGKLRKLLGV